MRSLLILCLLFTALPSFAGKDALCNIAFLDQSSEPDRRVIEVTLFKALAEEHQFIYSDRFNEIMIGRIYEGLKDDAGSGLYKEYAYDYETPYVYKVERRGDYHIRQVYRNKNDWWSNFYPGFWTAARAMKAAQAHYRPVIDQIVQNIYADLRKDALENTPLFFFQKYPDIPKEHYEYIQEIFRTLDYNARLRGIFQSTLEKLVLTVENWGTAIAGYDFVRVERRGKYLRQSIQNFVGGDVPLVFPSSARMPTLPTETAPSFQVRIAEFERLDIIFARRFERSQLNDPRALIDLDQEISSEATSLSSFFAGERERLRTDGAWKDFYLAAAGWIKGKKDLAVTPFLRIHSVVDRALTDHLRALQSEQVTIGAALAGIAHRIEVAQAVGGPEAAGVVSRLTQLSERLKLLNVTVTGWIANARAGQASVQKTLHYVLEMHESGAEHGEAIRSELQALQPKLGLPESLQGQVKKGWF